MHPFASQRQRTVASLGETRLIASIRRWLGPASPRAPFGIGDDCAVLPPSRVPLLVTVDPVIYGRHFDDAVPPAAAGGKLLRRNLSDIAAMGGEPLHAVIAMTLDPRVRLLWLERFYRGLAATARSHRVRIVGGDIAEAPGVLAASLTLIGRASGPRVLTRSGAKTGDWIFVTGRLGGSLASGHHHGFRPRLTEGAWLARRPEVRAMMDVSDGLAKDIHALIPPGASASLDAGALPCRAGVSIRNALTDGEDYELLLAVAATADRPALLRAWKRRFPSLPLTCIGRIVPAGRLPPGSLDLGDYHGYEHLR